MTVPHVIHRLFPACGRRAMGRRGRRVACAPIGNCENSVSLDSDSATFPSENSDSSDASSRSIPEETVRPQMFRDARAEQRDDLAMVETAVIEDGAMLEYASPRLRDDVGVVRLALASRPSSFRYASPRLRADRDTILRAVEYSGAKWTWWILPYVKPPFATDLLVPFALGHGISIHQREVLKMERARVCAMSSRLNRLVPDKQGGRLPTAHRD